LAADFSLSKINHGKRKFLTVPGYLGQGKAYQSRVDALVKLTNAWKTRCVDKGEDDPIIVWALHFDPTLTDEVLELLNADNFKKATMKEKIPAILCGHTHEAKIKFLGNGCAVFTAGTVSQCHAPHGNDFQILEFDMTDGKPEPKLSIKYQSFEFNGFNAFKKITPQLSLKLA
jgi:predicted phosphodiesterase